MEFNIEVFNGTRKIATLGDQFLVPTPGSFIRLGETAYEVLSVGYNYVLNEFVDGEYCLLNLVLIVEATR
jgi:hypothetical protein